MPLREEIQKQGNWLFRHRSYIPLLFLPLLLLALKDSDVLERLFGDSVEDGWDLFCVVVSFAGLFIRALTIGYVPAGTSGRNTERQVADRLNTTGMYSVVRHPLYLGNFLIMLGIVMFTQVWWIVVVSILAFWLYYERIIFAEEEFLREKYGDAFLEWARRTPAFLPRLKGWKGPELPFSFRTVLRREYSGLLVITSSFTSLEVLEDMVAEGRVDVDGGWVAFFVAGLILYLTFRTLKKKTRLLHVEGR